MTYDFTCPRCCVTNERSCLVGERDNQVCDGCGRLLTREFRPSQIMIPERFGLSMQALTPTYAELAAQDKRNDDYLNEPKEPAKPSFEDCLEKECIKNRVDPRKLADYKLEDFGNPNG